MKSCILIIFMMLFFCVTVANAGTLDTIDALEAAPDESDKMLIRDSTDDKSITTLYLMRLLEGSMTNFEIHSDNLASELAQLLTMGATTISANQWAALGGMPETLTGTEIGYADGVTSSIQTQIDNNEGELDNEAGLYSALSDVSQFYEAGDNIQTDAATSRPATCTTGELFVDTDADTDGSLYICVSTNTWKEDDDDGTGDMLEATWDSDTDGFIDNDKGGTDQDSSAWTGVATVAAGTWSAQATLTHELGGNEADVSAYSGLVGITGGTTAEVDTAAELETYAGLGAFANEYLDDASAAAMNTTLGLGTSDSPQFSGIEMIENDDHSDCSAFSATGGGIFYDDSEGVFKKCEDNVLSVLNTDTGAGSYLPIGGGTLTGELVADNLGVEFTAGDDHSDCSAFSATGGGIFFDDSEGIFKKCEDNVLSDLNTDTGAGSYLPLAGGTLTGEVTIDNLGAEFTAGDDHSNCSAFSATGGGIFYDDSEGVFKKCQDNVLTDLDTGGSGSVNVSGTPVADDIAQFTDVNTIKGMTYAELAAIAGFETALENVLDLADLQGALTDGQVPNNITITAPAGSTWDVADSITHTSVYSGTTSLDEATAANDSGASIIGVFDEFGNSNSDTVQAVLNDLDAAITASSGTTISEGDSSVDVDDGGTGEVVIDIDDEGIKFIDGGTDQVDILTSDATTVNTLNIDLAVKADSFEADAHATPGIEFTDSDYSSGGKISVNANDANDAEMLLGVDEDGNGNVTYVDLDGVNKRVQINRPLSGGPAAEIHKTTGTSIDAEICWKFFIQSGTRDYTLPAEVECGGAGSGASKIFCFSQRGSSQLTIDAAAGDVINVVSIGELDPGDSIVSTGGNNDIREICLIGVDNGGTDTWYNYGYYSPNIWVDGGP